MNKLNEALENCDNKYLLKGLKDYTENAHSTEDLGEGQDREDICHLIDEIGVVIKTRINELL